MKLNEIRDNEGAHKKRMRVGRGPGSGKGKTSGRGVKGQKSRTGVSLLGFEGGQMPLYMRMPKRGFNNPNALKLAEVNLWRLQDAVDAKKLDVKSEITGEALVAAGVIRRVKDGVRILGTGELKAKLNLVVWSASAGAVKAIEAAGGSVTQQRIAAEEKAAARVEKRNAAKGKAPAPKAPKGDANKVSARAKRTAAQGAGKAGK
jgi:large subunit ribosomal protein L15